MPAMMAATTVPASVRVLHAIRVMSRAVMLAHVMVARLVAVMPRVSVVDSELVMPGARLVTHLMNMHATT
jgi:hypothetical protein